MRHFTQSEFACKCGCGFDDISPKLVDLLDELREYYDAPVTVTSGCRCEAHNKSIKGSAKKSQHLLGTAADIKVKGVKPARVARMAILIGANGVKQYNTFTHIDVRTGDAWHRLKDEQ